MCADEPHALAIPSKPKADASSDDDSLVRKVVVTVDVGNVEELPTAEVGQGGG